MSIYWRPIREADLPECLEIEPASIGDGLTGRAAALAVWRNLLGNPAFHGSIYESEQPIAGHRQIGCGLGVFVDPAFVDRELADPRPDINSRIVQRIASGHSALLDRDGIAAGNAGAGVDFVNLYGTWRDAILDAAQRAEIQTLLGTSFLENLAGFRFNRVLKEAVGRPTIELAHATGTYRLVAEFSGRGSALFVVTPASAHSAPFSVAARMYRYQVPVLRLRPAEQALLAAARDGKTDAELSAGLGISVEAVKKRWVSIVGRCEEFRPAILESTDAGSTEVENPDVESTRRGPQKRHRILAYVRAHPEELRPYAWT